MNAWQLSGREALINEIQSAGKWDMIVIGGGITGAGVAREAARQGLRVLVLEQRDFSWGTSSRSSKMVHGGLRYLASGNFRLTSHSVKERERLLNEAPGLVELLPYQWAHYKGQFPTPFVFNALLAFYDKFAGRRYRHYLAKEESQYQIPALKLEGLVGTTRFADAVTDDSRLVVRVLKEAVEDGAVVLNYAKVESVYQSESRVDTVKVMLEDGQTFNANADVIVSATGAWADRFRKALGEEAKIRPLRGSHLVVPSWRFPISQSLTLKHPTDGRSMFIYPWEGMTVVGTTDLDNPDLDMIEPHIHQQEVDYLLDAANALFPSIRLTESDVVSTFAGVRPIVSSGTLNPSAEKRDHSIWDDNGLITVSGGKLTTFRLIALDVLKAAQVYIPSLDYRDHDQSIFKPVDTMPNTLSDLAKEWQRRLIGFYGHDIESLAQCAEQDGWALVPGTKTYWAQLRHALRNEMVVHLDDALLRRTRIGLFYREGGESIKGHIAQLCQEELGWTDAQFEGEWQRYKTIWNQFYSLPKQV